MRARLAACVAVALQLMVVVSACGSTSPASPSATATQPPATPAVPLLAVTPGPLPSAVPSALAHEALNPDPAFDFGVVVQITPKGFHPAQLVAPCCQPVIWENLTNQPNEIQFVALQVRSGPIPSGGTYVYTPKAAVSLAYHSLTYSSMAGVVSVTPTS